MIVICTANIDTNVCLTRYKTSFGFPFKLYVYRKEFFILLIESLKADFKKRDVKIAANFTNNFRESEDSGPDDDGNDSDGVTHLNDVNIGTRKRPNEKGVSFLNDSVAFVYINVCLTCQCCTRTNSC